MTKTINIKDLKGRTIEDIFALDQTIGIIFTDGSRVSLELEQVGWGYGGCETCGWGGTPDVFEIVARDES